MALELGPINAEPDERARTLKRLNAIAIIAVADALLLGVLGPVHGGGYLALLVLCAIGSLEDRWDWWFPALVLVTLGPPGSLIGDYILRRKLQAQFAGEASA